MPPLKRIALLLPLLAVGLASFLFVRSKQGSGDTLLQRQRQAQVLTGGAVARVVRAAPDPITRSRGLSASCRPLGASALRNPWQCDIRYRSGRQIQWLVTISPRGSYTGDHQVVRYRGRVTHDTGEITGCCVAIP